MTVQERKAAAEAFIAAAAGRVPVLVHVGHASLHAARDLAAHAAAAGADALAALPPYYHKPDSIEAAVQALEFIAAGGGGLPLLYYHIPQMSGVALEPAALLEAAAERVPTLAGIKFSQNDVTGLAACRAAAGGRLQVMWGVDESLLAGLAAGATVRSAARTTTQRPCTRRCWSYAAGDGTTTLAAAQTAQERSRRMQSLINGSGGIAAAKALMPALGVDCGPTRLPLLYPAAGGARGAAPGAAAARPVRLAGALRRPWGAGSSAAWRAATWPCSGRWRLSVSWSWERPAAGWSLPFPCGCSPLPSHRGLQLAGRRRGRRPAGRGRRHSPPAGRASGSQRGALPAHQRRRRGAGCGTGRGGVDRRAAGGDLVREMGNRARTAGPARGAAPGRAAPVHTCQKLSRES